MRFILSLLIWVVFVGGLYLYTTGRDRSSARISAAPAPIEKEAAPIRLELTPTFSAQEDPFALKTNKQSEPFEIRLNGSIVPVENLALTRGKTIIIDDISAVSGALNELFVKASPPVSESSLGHGVRVRLLSRGGALADETIWSSGGGLVSGTVSFSTGGQSGDQHDQ